MTVGQYIGNVIFIIGCVTIAVLLLLAMWHFFTYVFFGSDDQERLHAKKSLLHTSITLMFAMIFWGIFSMLGYVLGMG